MIPNDRQVHIQLFISRPDGQTWEDVSDYVSFIEMEMGDVSRIGTGLSGVDGVARQLTFRLIDDENNLSPTDQTSSWNQFDGQYAPLLYPYREVQLKVAVTALGETPSTWMTLFHGYLGDEVSVAGSTASCLCRDLSKRLQDCYIEETRQYGSAEGVALETVLQQILDDNLGTNEVILYCPISPGYMVLKTDRSKVEYKSVWDALQDMVAQIGWFLGYRWDSNTNQFRLTLLEPPRGKTTPDFALSYEDDIYVQELGASDVDVRNAVLVSCRDEATGKKITVRVEDAESIAKFGRRAMQIEEGDTSLITSQSEAEAMANVALSDLKDLSATTRIDMPFSPELDVFAGIEIQNPRISSTNDFFGVESVRHTIDFEGGTIRTSVIASGKIIGGRQRWLRMDTRPGSPGEPPYPVTNLPPDTPIWDTCEFVRNVTLRWHPVARAAEYEIRRVDADWGTELGRVWHGTETTAVITPLSRSETFYLKARDAEGRYSQTAATKTLTNATPSTPPQPTVQAFFSCLWITINSVADNDIVSYKLYMTPCDESGNPTGDTEVTTYLSAGRATYNAAPGSRYIVEVAACDVLGEGSKSIPVYASTRKIEGVAEFAQELIPPRIVNELPTLPDEDYPEGCLVVLTTDHVLYRCTGDEWDASVNVDLIAGQIKAGMIAAGAIGAEEIAAGEILADHFAAGSIEAYIAAVQEAFIDDAHIVNLEADKITTERAKIKAAQIESIEAQQIVVSGSSPGIPLTKPAGAHLWHFDGSLVSTDGIAPLPGAVATLRPDGRFGGCGAVEVGTTNLVANPETFEGWTVPLVGNTSYGVVDFQGRKCFRVRTHDYVGNGSGWRGVYKYLFSQNMAQGESVTVQVDMYVEPGTFGGNFNGELHYTGVLAKQSGNNTYDLSRTDTWQRLTLTCTATASGLGEVILYYYAANQPTDIDYVSYTYHPQVERLPFPTSFVNGARAAGNLPLDVLPGIEAGTIAFRARYNKTAYEGVSYPYFLSGGYSGSNFGSVKSSFALNRSNLLIGDAVGTLVQVPVPDGLIANLDDGEWFYGAFTWEHTAASEWTYRLAVGSRLGYGTTERVSSIVPADLTTLYLGSLGTNAGTISGTWFDELLVAPLAATPEQMQAWHAMGAPFVDPDSRINADAAPISAASGQVYIGEPGIAVANGAMIFVSGTFSSDQLGRLITAAVDRPLTTDPDGDKSVFGPVKISSDEGAIIWKEKLNVWAGTGGSGDVRYIHDGRVTNAGIIEMDAEKLTSGTVPFARLPGHLMRSAPGLSGVVQYFGSTYVAAGATVIVTFSTAMPYVPKVLGWDEVSTRLPVEASMGCTDITTTGFRFSNNMDVDQTILWLAICASGDPSSSSCSECQTNCQDECQSSCQDSCELDGGCQVGCESTCETLCEAECQTSCMQSCQPAACQITCQYGVQILP